jgi:hypothetical protein
MSMSRKVAVSGADGKGPLFPSPQPVSNRDTAGKSDATDRLSINKSVVVGGGQTVAVPPVANTAIAAAADGPYSLPITIPIDPDTFGFNGPPNNTSKHVIPTPSRMDRRLHFGIDCADLVHFTHWYDHDMIT